MWLTLTLYSSFLISLHILDWSLSILAALDDLYHPQIDWESPYVLIQIIKNFEQDTAKEKTHCHISGRTFFLLVLKQ